MTDRPPGTTWDPDLYDKKHAFVWEHGASLLDLLDPRPGERILDLGCGTGALTAELAERGCAVIGLDSDPNMVERARVKFPAVRFEVGDARDFTLPEPVDAVFSNAVLHWVKDAAAAVRSVRRALAPGGRFVAEFGGRGNVRALVDALTRAAPAAGAGEFESPWYFPSVGEYAGLLEREGLEVTFAQLFDRPTPLAGEHGLRDWVRMFAGDVVRRVPAGREEEFFRLVEDLFRPELFRDGMWTADYRRLRVVARAPPNSARLPGSGAALGGAAPGKDEAPGDLRGPLSWRGGGASLGGGLLAGVPRERVDDLDRAGGDALAEDALED